MGVCTTANTLLDFRRRAAVPPYLFVDFVADHTADGRTADRAGGTTPGEHGATYGANAGANGGVSILPGHAATATGRDQRDHGDAGESDPI
jgi:hypothetical protein